MKRVAILLIILVIALSSSAGAQGQAVELEYKFKEGQVDVYLCSMVVSTTMTGESIAPVSISSSYRMRQRVLKVLPDGSAKIRQWVGDFTQKGSGLPNASTQTSPIPPGGITLTMTMAKDGRIINIDNLSEKQWKVKGVDLRQYIDQFKGWGVLPKQPRQAVGGTWTQKLTSPLGVAIDITSTLVAVSTGAEQVAEIKSSFNGSGNLPEMKSAGSRSADDHNDNEKSRKSDASGVNMSGNEIMHFSVTHGKMLDASVDTTAVTSMNFGDAKQSSLQHQAEMTVSMKMTMMLENKGQLLP